MPELILEDEQQQLSTHEEDQYTAYLTNLVDLRDAQRVEQRPNDVAGPGNTFGTASPNRDVSTNEVQRKKPMDLRGRDTVPAPTWTLEVVEVWRLLGADTPTVSFFGQHEPLSNMFRSPNLMVRILSSSLPSTSTMIYFLFRLWSSCAFSFSNACKYVFLYCSLLMVIDYFSKSQYFARKC